MCSAAGKFRLQRAEQSGGAGGCLQQGAAAQSAAGLRSLIPVVVIWFVVLSTVCCSLPPARSAACGRPNKKAAPRRSKASVPRAAALPVRSAIRPCVAVSADGRTRHLLYKLRANSRRRDKSSSYQADSPRGVAARAGRRRGPTARNRGHAANTLCSAKSRTRSSRAPDRPAVEMGGDRRRGRRPVRRTRRFHRRAHPTPRAAAPAIAAS